MPLQVILGGLSRSGFTDVRGNLEEYSSAFSYSFYCEKELERWIDMDLYAMKWHECSAVKESGTGHYRRDAVPRWYPL